MNSVPRPDIPLAADYVGVLRRRWWIALVLTIVGAAAAYGYVTVAPKTYSSVAAVLVTPTGADQSNQLQGARTSGAVNLDTEAQLVTSASVATIAGHMLHSPLTAWQLSQEVAVTVPPNSQVLDIACQAPTAAGAAACANAFASAYLQNRSATSVATINAQLQTLQGKASTLEKTISALNARVHALPSNSPTKVTDESQLTADRNTLHSLTNQVAGLTGQAANDSGGSIITHATAPAKPSSPKKLLFLPSGIAGGLVLGLIFAFVADRRDKRIHSAQDVERYQDLPALVTLPSLGRQSSIASPRSKTGQGFTELGHSVAAALGEGHHVVLVTGATPGVGGSVVAANLAATLARTHSAVVLLCADLSGSVAPRLFGVTESGDGLAELIAGNADVRDVMQSPDGLAGLWLVPPGSDPSLAVYNLQYDRARTLISQLRQDARYVVIEVQPGESGADTFALGEFADAALISVEVSRTTRAELADCARRLRQLRTPVLGAVVSPPIAAEVAGRQPRKGQSRSAFSSRDNAGHAEAGRGEAGRADMPALSGLSGNGTTDRPERSFRSRDGRGDRDRANKALGS